MKTNFCIAIYMFFYNTCLTYSSNLTENCGKTNVNSIESDWRIVGGSKTLSGEFPWQILLTREFTNDEDEDMMAMCGGSIINEEFILTAAHCVSDGKDVTEYKVYLGEHDLDRKEGTEILTYVQKIISHERYDPKLTHNDIALVKLKGKIDFKNKHKFLKPICLASPTTQTGKDCYATGFGQRKSKGPNSQILLKVYEPLYDVTTCKAKLKYVDYKTNICGGGRTSVGSGTCMGDSGGPLQCKASDGKWYQVGITSWGIPCGNRGLPDVFTRVSAYYDWIQKTINRY